VLGEPRVREEACFGGLVGMSLVDTAFVGHASEVVGNRDAGDGLGAREGCGGDFERGFEGYE
jgi:hypothetical protein